MHRADTASGAVDSEADDQSVDIRDIAEFHVGTRRYAAGQHERSSAETATSCQEDTERVSGQSRFHAQWEGGAEDTGQKSGKKAGRERSKFYPVQSCLAEAGRQHRLLRFTSPNQNGCN